MRCRDIEPLLPQYLDDALSPRERERVSGHLAGCPDCRRDLAALEHSIGALNGAGQERGPDLWSQFQAHLERGAGVCSRNGGHQAGAPGTVRECRRIADLLPAYVDGMLEAGEQASVARHLAGCASCASEEQTLAGSLLALEAAGGISAPGKAPAGPDLWTAFTARLGATLSCQEVREVLPTYLESEVDGPQATAVRCHLDGCPACAAEVSAFERSLGALERVGSAAPGVDLWPAFAERLEREQNRRHTPVWAWRPSLGRARLLLRPTLGLAVILALLLGSQALRRAPQEPQVAEGPPLPRISPELVRPEEPDRDRAIPAPGDEEPRAAPEKRPQIAHAGRLRKRTKPALVQKPRLTATRPESRRKPRSGREVRPQVATNPVKSRGTGTVSSAVSALVIGSIKLDVAYNRTDENRGAAASGAPATPPVRVNSQGGVKEVMPEVVQAVGYLAANEDTANRAFGQDGADADAH
jgi:anti-sigma factor RsiW